MPIPAKGCLLGIDYGTVRIGLACCDPDRILAYPLTTIVRRSPDADAAAFRQVIAEEKIVGIVLGFPISLNGNEGPKAKEVRSFQEWLSTVVMCPIELWDERFSSSHADDRMRESQLKRKNHKGMRDQVAAKIILQNFIEGYQN